MYAVGLQIFFYIVDHSWEHKRYGVNGPSGENVNAQRITEYRSIETVNALNVVNFGQAVNRLTPLTNNMSKNR